MKFYKLNIVLFLSISILTSCDGLIEETEEKGKYTFWSNFDGPPIDIFVNNNLYGSISSFYPSNPGCDADGCVTVHLATGIYSFEAIEQPNNSGSQREWDGTIEIKPNGCGTLGLSP